MASKPRPYSSLNNFELQTVNTLPDLELIKDIKTTTEGDTWATEIIKELQKQPENPSRDDLEQFEQQDGLLLRDNLLCR
jgi:hypothetical protein